ncbi:YodC family protein [Pseudochelatococcus sp. G4_1912]|uniref:YodC family protein n=1 Tax=Pseudochelatococcus sp. G4_1912 TaxID=3114288 RepID=UPI0039C6EDD6
MSFTIGDVVMLKSGGPALTITDVSPEGISVVWYADSEDNFRTTLLPPETLILFDDEDDIDLDDEDDEDDEDDDDDIG